jgi:hypothetical protein
MTLSVKSLALTSGLLWGGGVFTCGLINLAAPKYGHGFLKLLKSIYPGFHYSRTLQDVFVGTGYGIVDGAAAGALFAALYNSFAEPRTGRAALPQGK